MKRVVGCCLLAGFVGAPVATLAAGETWTRPQQEVADVFAAWARAEMAGDVERLMTLMSPAITAWDFAKPVPMDRAAFHELTVEGFKKCRVLACEFAPSVIRVEGKSAVAQGRYLETLKDDSGAARTFQGTWSASLIRQANKWVVLGIGWAEDTRALDENTIRAEVSAAMHGFLAACNRCDLEDAWSYQSADPEYAYVDIRGERSDAATARRSWGEFFASCASMKHTTVCEDVQVLGPEAAVLTWRGSAESVMKNGATLRFDPSSSVAVFRRIDGTWKIVHLQDSSSRPQATPPPSVTATP